MRESRKRTDARSNGNPKTPGSPGRRASPTRNDAMTTIRSPRPGERVPATPKAALSIRDSARIRWSKVMTARARMAVDYYERDEVKERVLDAVLAELARD